MENQEAKQTQEATLYVGQNFWQTNSAKVVSGYLDISALEDDRVKAFITEKNGKKSLRVKFCTRKEKGKHGSTHFMVVDTEHKDNGAN